VNIKFYPEDGSYYEVDGEELGGWLPWHSDLIYTGSINRGGILRPLQLPENGGLTGFIDQIAAYDRLSETLKPRIESLHVVYEVQLNMAKHPYGSYPRVIHPMVFTQKETGRKVLNVSPGFAIGIYEMGDPEGDSLLKEIVDHCVDPQGAYYHEWKEGDLLLWDNWRTLHCATGIPANQTRVMQRTTIKGDYALGRELDGAGKHVESIDV
jgi:taurine dioxygenase